MFGLLAWADLKKYRFFYWFLVPAFVPKEPFLYKNIHNLDQVFSSDQIADLNQMEIQKACIIYINEFGNLKDDSLENWKNYDLGEIMIGFNDTCSILNTPGWTLRNFLYAIKVCWKIKEIKVILDQKALGGESRKCLIQVLMPGDVSENITQTIGWEKNNSGKMGPKMVDLGAVMDPKRLAETAVNLNLKLMKWRAIPRIDLDALSNVKCLLFGAGTLGCYTARALMAWGVGHISFIDSGKVSFSNPVRQPLFTFNDCLDGGRYKAEAAADALKQIFPGIITQGHGKICLIKKSIKYSNAWSSISGFNGNTQSI